MRSPSMPSSAAATHVVYAHDGVIRRFPWRGNRQTLLQHLREQRRLTGTKEGCAEGDCGACLVLIGELDPGCQRVRYRSANACFMPFSSVHGRLLVTVESLGRPGTLHPVQIAMIEQHASQCGFCTPGFVVSLYEHYLHHDAATPVGKIHDQLSGNLCRCTGYAPILRAAEAMFALPRVARDQAADAALLRTLSQDGEACAAALHADGDAAWLPADSDSVAATIESHPDATLLGGSTDVGLWITKQLKSPRTVIHLTRADDLRRVETDGGGLRIGAAASLTDAFAALGRLYPEFEELWRRFASPAVRHVGTLGGNIANGSPIGDSMPALISVGASLVLRRASTRRELPLQAFYIDYQRTALLPGEFVEAIRIPPRPPHRFVRAYKVSKRADDDISAVCMAMALDFRDGKVNAATIATGGMAAMPRRAPRTEASLIGKPFDEAAAMEAAAGLAEDFQPISDHRASSGYRMRVAGNLLVRAALERAGVERTRVQDVAEGGSR